MLCIGLYLSLVVVIQGKHDGSVGGISYFHCKPKHGVFVPLDKAKLSQKVREPFSHSTIIGGHNATPLKQYLLQTATSINTPKTLSPNPIRRGFPPAAHAVSASANVSEPKSNPYAALSPRAFLSPKGSTSNLHTPSSAVAHAAAATPTTSDRPSTAPKSTPIKPLTEAGVKIGDRVLCNVADKDGVVGFIRYLGEIKGETGVCIGVELHQPLGKHNGTVHVSLHLTISLSFQCRFVFVGFSALPL
jgi:hypothetical protein